MNVLPLILGSNKCTALGLLCQLETGKTSWLQGNNFFETHLCRSTNSSVLGLPGDHCEAIKSLYGDPGKLGRLSASHIDTLKHGVRIEGWKNPAVATRLVCHLASRGIKSHRELFHATRPDSCPKASGRQRLQKGTPFPKLSNGMQWIPFSHPTARLPL